MNTLVISPVGEPGSGKSTFSFWLVQALKMRGVRAEFVPEVIKYESYSPEAMAKVVSGKYDFRLLARQHAFTKPLIGRTEVIVNDGCLPAFFYYSALRMAPEPLARLRAKLDHYMTEQQPAEHRYVTAVREHAYDHHGRRENEADSQALRQDLLGMMAREFGIQPLVLGDQAMRERYADALTQEVLAQLALDEAPTRRRGRQP